MPAGLVLGRHSPSADDASFAMPRLPRRQPSLRPGNAPRSRPSRGPDPRGHDDAQQPQRPGSRTGVDMTGSLFASLTRSSRRQTPLVALWRAGPEELGADALVLARPWSPLHLVSTIYRFILGLETRRRQACMLATDIRFAAWVLHAEASESSRICSLELL